MRAGASTSSNVAMLIAVRVPMPEGRRPRTLLTGPDSFYRPHLDMNDMAARVATRFKQAQALAKGDILEVLLKRGNWWTEMRRGAKLVVRDVRGDQITLIPQGWAEGGFTLRLSGAQDDRLTLESDKLRRSIVVRKVG